MIRKNHRQLTTLEEWFEEAPPKQKERQWQDGRSAKESARAWIDAIPNMPREILDTIYSHSDFSDTLQWIAEPEAKTRIDLFAGEPPNLDVLIGGEDAYGSFVIAVEAKVDESFGSKISHAVKDAQKLLANNPDSKKLARITQLAQAIFGVCPKDIGHLRYQLLTATMAALRQAERQSAQRTVLIVHEFVTLKTSDKRHHNNHMDLSRFINYLSPEIDLMQESHSLLGPFFVPCKPLSEISFYVGKAVRNLRAS